MVDEKSVHESCQNRAVRTSLCVCKWDNLLMCLCYPLKNKKPTGLVQKTVPQSERTHENQRALPRIYEILRVAMIILQCDVRQGPLDLGPVLVEPIFRRQQLIIAPLKRELSFIIIISLRSLYTYIQCIYIMTSNQHFCQ